ncbi:MAG: RagB/SusD family nutrient uptake outer membrane protein [Bacteroidales bacterium]|nr:RagB/SusD family nutrient uptake outer membrane protein [Bacteroidales bacterium]
MKKILSAFTLAALFTAVSCTDPLDQLPTNQYTDAQVWQDDYLIESHLANLYAMSVFMINDAACVYGESPVNVDFARGEGFAWNINLGYSAQGEGPIHATTFADEAKISERGSQVMFREMKLFGIKPNGSELRWWSNGYYLNRQLNHFIESMETSSLSTAKARMAEARFLRAFNYFAMVKRYGGVPLITKETHLDADEAEIYPPRNKEKDCWDFIIKEATDAAGYLDANPPSGRASRWSALALAARAALYAGSIAQWGTVQLDGLVGIESSEAEGYYKQAITACEEIMGKSGHGLYKGSMSKGYVANLEDIFLVKDNTEVLLAKHHQGTAGQMSSDLWSWDVCMSPKPNAWSVGQYALPYYDFVEQFDFIDGRSGRIDHATLESKPWTMDELWGDRDPRLRAWTWTNRYHWAGAAGSPWGTDTVSLYKGIRLPDGSDYFDITNNTYQGVMCWGDQMNELARASISHTGFGVAKYLDPQGDCMNWFNCSTTDYIIFRYAEVLLNYAEACFETGRAGDALDAVNQIRSRAGVAGLTRVDREAIRKERLCELCFENHRYWDVRRWRVAADLLSRPHTGISYVLDWDSYSKSLVKTTVNGKEVVRRTAEPKFWIEFEDHIDSKVQDPTFPESNYYLPIGDGTTAVNPNLRENPGY